MKAFNIAKRIIIFVLIFALLFLSLSYLLRPDNGSQKTRFMGFYALPKNSLDVAFVGASSIYRGWAAPYAYDKYGFTSYPLSSQAQFPALIKYFMIEALKYQHPKLFVVDLRQFRHPVEYYIEDDKSFEGNLRCALDNMRYSQNRIDAINEVNRLRQIDPNYKQNDNILNYYFDLAKYKSLWTHLTWAGFNYAKDDPLKGFLFDTTISPVYVDPAVGKMTECAPLSKMSKAVLVDLLDFCRDNKLQVLFTDTPYAIPTGDQMINNEIKSIINSYGYSGFKVLDGNADFAATGLDPNMDFYNVRHLNLLGAVKYTTYLGAYLKKNYSLPDHRGDSAFDDWARSYQVWLKQATPLEAKMNKAAG